VKIKLLNVRKVEDMEGNSAGNFRLEITGQINSSISYPVSDPPADSQCWHMSQCVPSGEVGRAVQMLCVLYGRYVEEGKCPI